MMVAWDVVTSGMTSPAPTQRTEWIEAKAFVPTGRSIPSLSLEMKPWENMGTAFNH